MQRIILDASGTPTVDDAVKLSREAQRDYDLILREVKAKVGSKVDRLAKLAYEVPNNPAAYKEMLKICHQISSAKLVMD